MNKSVNGKSFDEVFGQRGKHINRTEMVVNEIYFCYDFNNPEWRWIHNYTGYKTYLEHSISLDENGTLIKGLGTFDGCKIHYEATPDQIALLNLYKSETR